MPKGMSEELKFAVRVLRKANEKQDQMALLAALNLIKDMPADVKTRAIAIASTPRPEGVKIVRRGRRADLREERPDDLIVKVSIAGSGYGNWRTDKEKDDFVPTADEAGNWGWEKINSSVTCYRRDHDKGPELLFAGPGGKGTTGSPGGAFDRGSNSIDALVAEVPKQVKSTIKAADPGEKKNITLLIRAHSRGSVAADIAANQIKEFYEMLERVIQVELVVIDPVPGPSQSGEKVKIDVGGLDESTLVMSLNPGKGFFLNDSFTSQRVFGAKRIILSTQNHSVGLSEGFVFKGRRYTGSAMNSLPEGIYVDTNKTAESSIELNQVSSLATFKASVDKMADEDVSLDEDEAENVGLDEEEADEGRPEAFLRVRAEVKAARKTVPGKNLDNRLKIIDQVLRDYLLGV
jgi:hypothetical protein